MIIPNKQCIIERRNAITGFQGGGISEYDDHPEQRDKDLCQLYYEILGFLAHSDTNEEMIQIKELAQVALYGRSYPSLR